MGNMLDYLEWRGDLTLAQSPFNEVDNLILSQLSYVNFEYVVPPEWIDASITVREAAKRYFHLYREEDVQGFGYMVRNSALLLKKLAACARFKDARLTKFQNMIEFDQIKQFSALHIELTDETVYVAFRGTDTTIIGWKENFNMIFQTPVPSQYEAVRYLEDTAGTGDSLLRLGGHSKGGNLAMYAAVMCREDLKPRILEVYCNDGPGFDEKMIGSNAYKEMRERIRTIVPESSVVGLLLEHEEAYAVVKSDQSLIMQHDVFSWQVSGSKLIRVKQVARESKLVEAALKSWMNQFSPAERKQFVDDLFQIFQNADIWTIEDLSRAKWRKASQLLRALNQSQKHKDVLARALRTLFREGRKVLAASRKMSASDNPP